MKQLLQKLVQVDTTVEKGELALAEVISKYLAKAGIDSSIDAWDGNRANIFTRIKSTGKKPSLLFLCHLDVVEPGQEQWKYAPFDAIEKNGRIYGRGSTDMKGGIVAVISAIEQIVDSKVNLEGDILFLAAAGEETDSCGIKRFIRNNSNQLQQLAGVVAPEPTNFEIITAHRGILWLEVVTKGKTAHGSMPHLGINAIKSMQLLLNELDNFKIQGKPHKLLGQGSISINTISGGKDINVVPDQCSIKIDIRTLPAQSHNQIIDDFEQLFARLKEKHPDFEAAVSIIRIVEALETDSNCSFVSGFCSAVGIKKVGTAGFTTDGPFLASLGVPVVIFGPGQSDLCHKPNEYIRIIDVEKAAQDYKDVILKFLT